MVIVDFGYLKAIAVKDFAGTVVGFTSAQLLDTFSISKGWSLSRQM
jgi:hypothetical protein